MDRKRFVWLGTAGLVGVVAGFGCPSRSRANRSVRVTDPEFGARGDGRADDGPAIRRALSDPTVREVIFPRNPGYAVDMGREDWTPLPLRSGVRVVGHDLDGPLIRAGGFVNNRFMFRNEHAVTDVERGVYAIGDDDIRMESVCIVGRMQDVDLVELDDRTTPRREATINTAIAVRSQRAYGRSAGFKLLGCRILDWPGVALSCNNLEDFLWEGNRISRVHRGGLILNFANTRGAITGNVVTDTGDHAIGLNSDGNVPFLAERAPSTDVRIENNVLARTLDLTRTPGPALAVRGGSDILIEGNNVLQSMASGMYFEEHGGFACRGLRVLGNRMENCGGGAIDARQGVQGIASRNMATGCSEPPRFSAYRNRSDDFKIDATNSPRP